MASWPPKPACNLYNPLWLLLSFNRMVNRRDNNIVNLFPYVLNVSEAINCIRNVQNIRKKCLRSCLIKQESETCFIFFMTKLNLQSDSRGFSTLRWIFWFFAIWKESDRGAVILLINNPTERNLIVMTVIFLIRNPTAFKFERNVILETVFLLNMNPPNFNLKGR